MIVLMVPSLAYLKATLCRRSEFDAVGRWCDSPQYAG
jgi:hypothetical protein